MESLISELQTEATLLFEKADSEILSESERIEIADEFQFVCSQIKQLQYSKLFKKLCRCVKNNGKNQFKRASEIARLIVYEGGLSRYDSPLDWREDHVEIPARLVKWGCTELVRFS